MTLTIGVLALQGAFAEHVKICRDLGANALEVRKPEQLAGIDTVVVDMPPRMDDLVLTLLEMADEVLLVASMDIPSIKNLKVGIQTIESFQVT